MERDLSRLVVNGQRPVPTETMAQKDPPTATSCLSWKVTVEQLMWCRQHVCHGRRMDEDLLFICTEGEAQQIENVECLELVLAKNVAFDIEKRCGNVVCRCAMVGVVDLSCWAAPTRKEKLDYSSIRREV